MNPRLVKASLAAATAAAIAAGGTTYGLWSDFGTLTDNRAGADELTLVLGHPGDRSFDDVRLAPGLGATDTFVVSSRQGPSIPRADLRAQVADLVGHEDGCTSTTSELAEDRDCADTTTPGELVDDARIDLASSRPSPDADVCDAGSHPRTRRTSSTLGELAASPVRLLDDGTYLAPDQKVCVSVTLTLPASTSNAAQGDTATFDLRFLLDQVAPGGSR